MKKLTQDYSTEIIVIDSESTDRTAEIINSFNKIFKYLKYIKIKKKDFNYGGTRNFTVKMCKGRYISFISADAIPTGNKMYKYFLEDFRINNKVSAVFCKQVPRKDTKLINKIELYCRFEDLDRFVDSKGILFQNLRTAPEYFRKNKLFLYFLSNVCACYKRSFLLKHPFRQTQGAEDILMGSEIINEGYAKVYDTRCKVIHSHDFSISEYYHKQRRDYFLRFIKTDIKGYPRILKKIKIIFIQKESVFEKIKCYYYLFIYYLIKLLAVIDCKTSSVSAVNSFSYIY